MCDIIYNNVNSIKISKLAKQDGMLHLSIYQWEDVLVDHV